MSPHISQWSSFHMFPIFRVSAQGLKRLMSRITELHQEIKEVGVSPRWLCWGTSPGKPCENMRESEVAMLLAAFLGDLVLLLGMDICWYEVFQMNYSYDAGGVQYVEGPCQVSFLVAECFSLSSFKLGSDVRTPKKLSTHPWKWKRNFSQTLSTWECVRCSKSEQVTVFAMMGALSMADD